MINLKFLLGLYPTTEKIEAKEAALINEYNELIAYKASENLSRYFELKGIIESEAFKQKERELKAMVYPNSPTFQREAEYNKLKKSSRITNYFKVLASASFKNYTEVKDSSLLEEFMQHKAIVETDKFKKTQIDIKSLAYKTSEEFAKEKEFIALGKSPELKKYFKTIASEEFKLYHLLHDTDDLKHFIQLQEYANAHPEALNQKNKEAIEGVDAEKISEYLSLKKDTRFIVYFKFLKSPELSNYQNVVKSKLIDKYNELKDYIESDVFKERKAYLLLPYAKKWEQTEESKHLEAFKKLSADSKIQDFNKFSISPALKLYLEVEKSGEAAHFQELEAFIKSSEFSETKTYLQLSFEKKWQQTDEFKYSVEFKQILASDKFKWYTKIAESPKFNELKKWELTFEEEFNESQLNSEKWLTRYFWGDNLLKEAYSLSDDLQFYTDGKNLILNGSVLKIETRKENADGKSWNPMFGFMPREFAYTSGIINTGKSFRQKYGKFRAKIKMNASEDVNSTFWMVGNQIVPHVDVVKFHKNKYYISNFWKDANSANLNKNINNLSSAKPSKDFFIYELEWTPTSLIWRINNLEIKREISGVPQEEMYIQFSAGLHSETANNQFPSSMEIDWVRCYKETN